MGNTGAAAMMTKLTQAGGPLDYGPERLELLVRVLRTLAHGRAVSNDQASGFADELGIGREEADAFLRTVTERDADDQIVGALGLSLNEHPHRLSVDGRLLSAWCAQDTLFLPALIGQTATIESSSPVSGQPIRLRVSPRGVEEVNPAGAAVSMVIVDPEKTELGSVEAIWGTFCHHIFFFASREEAERWAAGRDDIEILSVDEGFALGRQFAARFLAHAA